MTTQKIIADVAAWLRSQAAARFTFKRAAAMRENETDGYRFETVPPAVYEMSMPHDAAEWTAQEQTAPIVAPCVIVTIGGNATHDTRTHTLSLPITLHIQCWNPGTLTPTKHGANKFTPTADGWKDAVTLADAIRADLANGLMLAAYAVGPEITVEYPELDSFNPAESYWRAAVNFTLSCPIFDKKNYQSLV